MDRTKSAVVKTNPKPVSVFYVWYTELCRRLNITPAPAVKPAKPKCQTVLDFVADRLKIDEWTPVLSALRQDTSLHVVAIRSKLSNCPFLEEVDTEEKARNAKRKCGYIWTAYILRQLLKSISHSLRNTQVLTYLELDNLPLFMEYLEPLLQALKKNQTLKTLSLSNCVIKDSGCQLVCSYLRFTPNIEVLNLSGCSLSPVSGEHLAKLIKYQQINRYCESWHSSLRYENPDAGNMRGIKRITINSNPSFGDAGLHFILDELEDDLWVKALDMQKCGFTEDISNRIVDIVDYNKTLEIVDLRQNELLSVSAIEKVFQILKNRQHIGMKTEFQWCATAVTLTWSSVYSSASKSSFITPNHNLHKTRSAPMKTSSSKASVLPWDPTVRKTRTVDSIHKGAPNFSSLKDTKKQVLELNDKLQKEIQKRKEIEKRNEELQSQLNKIKISSKVIKQYSVNRERSPVINVNVKKASLKENSSKEMARQNSLIMKKREANKLEKVQPNTMKNGLHKNGVTNGRKKIATTNGFVRKTPPNNMYDMLEKLLNAGQPLQRKDEDEIRNHLILPRLTRSKQVGKDKNTAQDSMANSHVSLYKYMEELKTDNR